jgi:hypothetical protein
MARSETISALSEAQGAFIGRLSVGALSVLGANATFLFLYFVYDLTLFQLVIVFWLECFWIGIFSALKIITASLFGDPYGNRYVDVSPGSGLLISLVAIGFVNAQFLSLFGLTGIAIAYAAGAFTDNRVEFAFFDGIALMIGISLLYFVGHGISFAANFIGLGEYRTAKVGTLLAHPFRRCLALLAAIVVAFAVTNLLPQFAGTTGFAIMLIVFKVAWDIRLHRNERQAFAGGPG